MVKLKIDLIPKKQQGNLARVYRATLKGPGIYSNQTVKACGHLFNYKIKGELPFGPPFFELNVEGPHEKKLNNVFAGKDLFYSGVSFNEGLGLYFFDEATDYHRLRRRISIYNLETGRKISAVEKDFTQPWRWRPNSDDLLLYNWADNLWKIWRYRSRKSDGIEDLYQGSGKGHISSNGRFMIICETGNPRVVLFDISQRGKII